MNERNERLDRKDIRRDEFASAVGKGVVYAETHSKGLLIGIGAVVVAAILGVSIYVYMGHRAELANADLADAVKVYQAPINPAAPKPNDTKEPSFADETTRRDHARALFQAVHDHYGMSRASDVAGMYLAEIASADNKLPVARDLWSGIAKSHKGDILGSQARLNLLALDRKEGKGQQAVDELRSMVEQPDAALPQDVALFELGKTLEDLHRAPEAVQSYRRIVDEFPQSPYHQEAQQKLSSLDPAHAGPGAGAIVGLPGGG